MAKRATRKTKKRPSPRRKGRKRPATTRKAKRVAKRVTKSKAAKRAKRSAKRPTKKAMAPVAAPPRSDHRVVSETERRHAKWAALTDGDAGAAPEGAPTEPSS